MNTVPLPYLLLCFWLVRLPLCLSTIPGPIASHGRTSFHLGSLWCLLFFIPASTASLLPRQHTFRWWWNPTCSSFTWLRLASPRSWGYYDANGASIAHLAPITPAVWAWLADMSTGTKSSHRFWCRILSSSITLSIHSTVQKHQTFSKHWIEKQDR